MTKQNWSAYPQLKMQTRLLLLMEERLSKPATTLLLLKREAHTTIWSKISLNLETEKLNIISVNNLILVKWTRKDPVILNCDQRKYVTF